MKARTSSVGPLWELVCAGMALAQEVPPATRVIERGPHHNWIESVGQTLDAVG